MNCKVCGSDDVSWSVAPDSKSSVVDGRLRMNDISVIAYLGCNACSATLKNISLGEIETMLDSTFTKES
jgi:hypothetical protein